MAGASLANRFHGRRRLSEPRNADFVAGAEFLNLEMQISWQAQHFVNLEVQISWQAQRFVNLEVQISWQAQHFVNLEVQITALNW